jgi:hypothetical protein
MGIDRFAVVVALGLAACGDDGGSASVDASPAIDSAPDVSCDYTEAHDTTNTMLSGAEPTALTIGSAPLHICGAIDTGHFDTSFDQVDGDFFVFMVPTDGDFLIHLTGPGLALPKSTLMQVSKPGSFTVYGFGVVEGDHGTLATHLTAGSYAVAVGAINPQDLAAGGDYTITIAHDTPDTRCPAKTGTPDHTEGTDGGANDVIDYDATNESSLSSSTTDAPEATGFTVAPATAFLITGTSENRNPGDDYMDRDTFAFTTGPDTTQMTVRLNWPATNADLDFRVYPMTTIAPSSIVGGLDASTSQPELETFAVRPNTTYWLWVALEDGGTAPADYSATLCGEAFSPP